MGTEIEFKPWPKIPRGHGLAVTITEKIDGTNACIVIKDGEIAAVQSRKRFITPDDDNFEFAAWVAANEDDLLSLGEGYHYGEWAGEKIQDNPHNIEGRKFFLFNTKRWGSHNPNTPACCDVVPVLYDGLLEKGTIEQCLKDLEEYSEDTSPEGVIVYYHSTGGYTKHTIKTPDGKWRS